MTHQYSFFGKPDIHRAIKEVVEDNNGVRPDCIVLTTSVSALILLSEDFLDFFKEADNLSIGQEILCPKWGATVIYAYDYLGAQAFNVGSSKDGEPLQGYRGWNVPLDILNVIRGEFQYAKEWRRDQKIGVHIW